MKQVLLRTIVVLMLLAFAGIDIAHIFTPDYFIKRSGVPGRRIADGVEPTWVSDSGGNLRWLRNLPFVRPFPTMSVIADFASQLKCFNDSQSDGQPRLS
jgi:hypothetical protein